MNRKYLAVFGLLLSLVFVTASTTRIASPLLIGLGNSGTKEIDFDSGNGSSNSRILTTADTNLSLAVSGTTRLTADTSGVTTTGTNRGANGSVGSPTYSFTSDTNTGLYRAGSSTLGIAAGGVATMLANGSSAEFADGSAGSPSMTFQNNTDLGFYRAGSESMGAAVSGSLVTRWNSNGFQLSNGSASFPILNFVNSPTTGLYRAGADQMGVAVAGSNVATFGSSGLSVPSTATVGIVDANQLEVGTGNGHFKVKVFSSSNTGGSSGTVTVGTTVLGVSGITGTGGDAFYVPMDRYFTVNAQGIDCNGYDIAGTNQVTVRNNGGSTNSYRIIIFYQ